MTRPALFVAVTCLAAAAAFAHSTVKRTDPASGSILPASPAQVVIEFNESARLVSVVAVAANGSERSLSWQPEAAGLKFTIGSPALAEGRNEIRWKALSDDGHPISGTVILVIKRPADAAGTGR